jgi:uracil-DNA glycosylase family 4
MPTKGIPRIYVPADGPIPASLMIVGEAPGEQEVKMKRGFVGPSGDELWGLIYRFLYLTRKSIYVTNTFHFPMEVPENKLTREDWIVARQGLAKEIDRVKPMVILALGAVATHALLPLTSDHDMETVNAIPHNLSVGFRGLDYQPVVIPSFHPAASFRDSSKLQYLVDAIKCTKDVMNGKRGAIDHPRIITDITSCQDQTHPSQLITALDTETLKTGDVYLIGVSSREGESAVVEMTDPKNIIRVMQHVRRPDVTTLLHNALFDIPVLAQVGIVPRRWIDTMTVAFLIQYLPLSLKELTYRLLNYTMPTYEDTVQGYSDLREAAQYDHDRVWQYAASDPSATLGIYNRMLPTWYAGMDNILQLDMDIQPIVITMMEQGIDVAGEQLNNLDIELEKQNFIRRIKIETIARKNGYSLPVETGKLKGTYFNPRSSMQLADLLYVKMGLGKGKKIKRTAGKKMSTNKKVLAIIKEEHPVVQLINDYKETATLQTSFLRSLQKHIQSDGRIHTDLSMTRIPHSGRFASSKPNLLAIPVRSDNGRKIRLAFVADEGYTFVSGDLSQIELRCLAHNSQDKEMLRVYRNDEDIHANTAMRVFGITSKSQLDDYKHRLPAKTCNFLICNLGTASALSRELISAGAGYEWTIDKCQDMIDAWFNAYPGVRKYLDGVGERAFAQGFITDMWGRKEILPQFFSGNEKTREEGVRIAANQQIQSGAQGIIKTIMRNVWDKSGREWARKGLVYPLLQIHDDYLNKARDEYVNDAAREINYWMENSTPQLTIPVKVGMKTGKVWGSMEKWEDK